MTITPHVLLLASASARRQELLSLWGVSFVPIPAEIEESVIGDESPAEMVNRLAIKKASSISQLYPENFVLGADTTVSLNLGDSGVDRSTLAGKKFMIFEKPSSAQDAERMLELLQGREHRVHTAFCLLRASDKTQTTRVVESRVNMRALDNLEISAYVKTGEGLDKAGAYGLQGIGSGLVASISGSHTSVIGLPLAEVLEELKKVGLWSAHNIIGRKS